LRATNWKEKERHEHKSRRKFEEVNQKVFTRRFTGMGIVSGNCFAVPVELASMFCQLCC
jgi:hypothetical protein